MKPIQKRAYTESYIYWKIHAIHCCIFFSLKVFAWNKWVLNTFLFSLPKTQMLGTTHTYIYWFFFYETSLKECFYVYDLRVCRSIHPWCVCSVHTWNENVSRELKDVRVSHTHTHVLQTTYSYLHFCISIYVRYIHKPTIEYIYKNRPTFFWTGASQSVLGSVRLAHTQSNAPTIKYKKYGKTNARINDSRVYKICVSLCRTDANGGTVGWTDRRTVDSLDEWTVQSARKTEENKTHF